MPKVITSPVEKWPGTVTLSDPLTLPQGRAFEEGLIEAQKALRDSKGQLSYEIAILEGCIPCVEKWDIPSIPSLTVNTFPLKPHRARYALISWLLEEIMLLYKDAEEVPNE